MRNLLAAVLLSGLAACSAATVAKVDADVGTAIADAKADLTSATTYYDGIKVVALAAEVAEPALAPAIDAGISALDALETTANATVADANADAPTAEALASTINTQAQALAATAASVVPSK